MGRNTGEKTPKETMATTTAASTPEKAEPEGTRPEHPQQRQRRSLDQELLLFSQQQQQDPPGRRLPFDCVLDKDDSDQSTVSSVSTRHFYYAELYSGSLYPSLPLDEDKESPCTDNDLIRVHGSEGIDDVSEISDCGCAQELRLKEGQNEHQVNDDNILRGGSRNPFLSAEAGEIEGNGKRSSALLPPVTFWRGKRSAERRRSEGDQTSKHDLFTTFTNHVGNPTVILERQRQRPFQGLRSCTGEQGVKQEVLEKPIGSAGRAGTEAKQEVSKSIIMTAARAKHIELDMTGPRTALSVPKESASPPRVLPGDFAVGPEDLDQASRKQEDSSTTNFKQEQRIPILPVAFTVNADANDSNQLQLQQLRDQLEQKELHVKTLEQELAILRGKLSSAVIAEPTVATQLETKEVDKISFITQ